MERVLVKHDFTFVSQKGSHKQFKGIVDGQKRRVTVLANRKSFNPKTLKSMIRQSGLTEADFFEDLFVSAKQGTQPKAPKS